MKKSHIIIIAGIIILLISSGASIYSISGDDSNANGEKAKKLYFDHCSKCHRKTGKGIKRVYPPLKNADYIQNASAEELLRGMLFGRSGVIVVNGKTYDGVMETEVGDALSDGDIALILTYVYRRFNNIDITVTEKDVQAARKAGKLPSH